MASKLVNCNCVDLSIYSVIYLGSDWCPHLRLSVQHSPHQSWQGADVCPGFLPAATVSYHTGGDGKGPLLALTEGTRWSGPVTFRVATKIKRLVYMMFRSSCYSVRGNTSIWAQLVILNISKWAVPVFWWRKGFFWDITYRYQNILAFKTHHKLHMQNTILNTRFHVRTHSQGSVHP